MRRLSNIKMAEKERLERGAVIIWIIIAIMVVMFCCLCLVAFFCRASMPVHEWGSTASEDYSPPVVEIEPPPSQAEETLILLSSVDVPIADPILLAKRLRKIEDIPLVLAETAKPIPIGSIEKFWVCDVDMDTYFQIEAELAYASDHVYFWVQRGVDYDHKDAKELVDEFEGQAYPTNRAFFGSEWSPGVDGDPHLYILFAEGLGDSVAGYYASVDEYSPLVHEYSNGHEMFYISAENVFLDDEFTDGVLAHEFQHMIHWHLDSNEDTWMNEGFSELASFLNGYDVGGFDYSFIIEPDSALTHWPSEPGQAAANYGQAFLFMVYFLDRFGSEMSRAVVASPANGLQSLDQVLAAAHVIDPLSGEPIFADDVYRDLGLTLLLKDDSIGDGRYVIHAYPESPQIWPYDQIDSCPLEEQERQVNQYGIDYIFINCNGQYTLTFKGAALAPVVPADAHSGDFAFWSNRGDVSDMTLTKTFDFRNVEDPIQMDYWIWYDIEKDYDYVYLEISTDDGKTWDILTTPSGTAENPSGNSCGCGYNGYSGGGSTPKWIKESVDLSEYSGKEVALRFEYITDAAVNGEGLLLDDVAINAAGYRTDFEQDGNGWQPEGFVRLYNRIPQTYCIVIVERGKDTRVREIRLDQDQRAEISLDLGDKYDDAVLMVIGTARYSWQPAPYRFVIGY